MKCEGEVVSLLLILLLIISVGSLICQPSNAQSIRKPTIPEFTLKFINNPLYLPPRYGIDPYTGKNVTFEDSYFIQNRSVELTIKNQPFTPYTDANGHLISLYYNISQKGYFGTSWNDNTNWGNNYFRASNLNYTVLSFGLLGDNGTNWGPLWLPTYSGLMDFRVQAFIGYSTTVEGAPDPLWHRPTYQTFYTGQTSNWSNTQTISIPDDSVSISTSSYPSSTSNLSGLSLVIIVSTAIVALVSVSLLFYFKKHKHRVESV